MRFIRDNFGSKAVFILKEYNKMYVQDFSLMNIFKESEGGGQI